VDNIDVDAATQRGIVVVNSPEGNTIAAAELTMAHLLALARYIPQADRSLRAGEWKRTQFTGVELSRKTLGIIGMGKIGREVARRARAFGVRIVAYDPFVPDAHIRQLGAEPATLETLLRESDHRCCGTDDGASACAGALHPAGRPLAARGRVEAHAVHRR